MNKNALDSFLTTEPSNLHYDRWLEKILSHISEDVINGDEFNDDFDSFFEPLLLKMSTSGTGHHGFINSEFAALVLVRRYYQFRKKRFEDENRWYIV